LHSDMSDDEATSVITGIGTVIANSTRKRSTTV